MKTTKIDHNGVSISIKYGQPSKNGRLIFGSKDDQSLVPFGEKWRIGANEATEITVSVPIIIDGKTLQSGTYSIYSIPNKESWTIVFNSCTGFWGKSLFGSPYKEKQDVLRTNVQSNKTEITSEQFTISLNQTKGNSKRLALHWDTTMACLHIDFLEY